MKPSRSLPAVAAVLVAFLPVACQPAAEKSPPPPAETAVPPAIQQVLLAQRPEGARDIHAVLPEAKPGDSVTLKARLLGAEEIFVSNRAAFLAGDPGKLTSCSDNPGDTCTTPWDACCDSPEVKRTSVATIQITDATGAVLRHGLKGVGGLKELSQVVVTGKVAPASSPGNLIVNATGIFVEPAP